MKDEILKLRALGYSYNKISKELGCAKSTVCYHCGVGQKEKSNKRQNRNRKESKRNILTRKVDKFLRSAMRHRYRDFQRRDVDGYLKNVMDKNFTMDEFIEKIGDNPSCYLTGRRIDLYDLKSYHIDHIVPKTKGGSNELSNLGLAIKEANIAKGQMTVNEFFSFCIGVLEHNGYSVVKT